MNSWRDQILKQFTPKVARVTLAADPDGLLLEEGILEGIGKRGFELIPFEDHIAFRYAYESKFRSRWDRGEQTDLVVVLRSHAHDLASLPHDLLQAGRTLSFNLGNLFPNLSYPVVAALDRADLDVLFDAQSKHDPDQLGDNATKEFILRHVFEIAPEIIKDPPDLLRVLLRRHYRGQRIPATLAERFIEILRQNGRFRNWQLETIIPDAQAFFTFLQERWPVFLDFEIGKRDSRVQEDHTPSTFAISGPIDLPFDHDDIRVYVDNLFLEGLLHAVPHEHAGALSKTWLAIGIKTDPLADRSHRINRLINALKTSIPAEDSRHVEWFHFARKWAELSLLINEHLEHISERTNEQITNLQAQLDAGFTAWLFKRYAGLINLPPSPPVMLHHLPRFLSRQVEEDSDIKVAMVIIDGLAFDQWLVVRNSLNSRQPSFLFREQAVFAWIPSLTSVSRQAAFAGKAPLFFPNSIHTTEKEPALWAQFWADHGLTTNEVVYFKSIGEGGLESLSEDLSHPKVRVAGLVVDKVDKIMHGMEMGSAGMHNQVRQWASQPFMVNLFNLLLDNGFRVYLTSDHGNVEAAGCGRPAEGLVADQRGVRARIYRDSLLRCQIKERFPGALEWPSVGLPEDYLSLLAPPRAAFVRETERIVGHGGTSLEEVIVPLVKVERKKI